MKAFKKHWCIRPISYVLSLYMMVLPLVLTLLVGGSPAHAQLTDLTRQGNPQWAVLDFNNNSGYGGPELGRQASDSLVLELGKSNKIDVVPRQQVLTEIQTLGLNVPLDSVGTQKLGRELSVDAVVTGDVATVSFDNNPRRATASVIVRVVDTNTGLLVNGAIAEGTSTPRPIPTNDDDSLVNQAIDNATFAGVRQIINYSLPRATVLQNEDAETVLLNKGTKDGLYDGLNMVVTRHGTEVARVRVSRASADNSEAVVTVRGAGVAPEDVATAIYELPPFSISGGRIAAQNGGAVALDSSSSRDSGHRSQFSGIGGILASILIGALLLSLVKRGSNDASLAGGQIGSPTAIEVGEFDPTGQSIVGGQAPGAPNIPTLEGDPSTLVGFQNYSPVAMHITANHGNINAFLLQEYHVFRPDFNGSPIHEFNTQTLKFTDLTIGGNPAPLAVLSSSSPVLNTWDDGADHALDYTTLGMGQQVIQVITDSNNIAIGSGIHQNLVGKRWAYKIEALWQNTTSGSGGGSGGSGVGNGSGFALTTKSSTNPVTYVQPVILQAPTDSGQANWSETSATKVFLTLNATLISDAQPDYVLEISGTPAFSSKQTFKPYNTGVIQSTVATQANPRGGPAFAFFNPATGLDLTSVASALGNPPALYARVGVRDGSNGTNNRYNPYVYSPTVDISSLDSSLTTAVRHKK